MHPTCSGRHPPCTGTPSTCITRIQTFPHPHATPRRLAILMQATPPPIPHVAPHAQRRLSRASHASSPLPPSHTPCPHPDAPPLPRHPAILICRPHPRPSSRHAPTPSRPRLQATHLPIPHAMPPCLATFVCRPPARLSSCHAPMPGHPHMQVMHPPMPHATPTVPAALICTPHAHPSLVPHPDAWAIWQPLIACHTPTHPSCESYLPSFTLHGSTLGLLLPNGMRFAFFLLLANLKVNPLLLVKRIFYMPISHHDWPSASTTMCRKLKLLALLPNANQHPLSSSLTAHSFSL